MRLSIKPLSVNDAWKGRRFRSDKYKKYQLDIAILLRKMVIPSGPLEIRITWGLSNLGGDWDNPIKPFQDCLSNKYGFNDNRIMRGVVDKVKVPKGQEFIAFEIMALENMVN